jgi:hypothetical protein
MPAKKTLEAYKILGEVKVTLDRDGQKTDFAEYKIYDYELGENRTVDVYYAYCGKKSRWGVEVYQGPNYVAPYDSKKKSYSRHYPEAKGLPAKYVTLVQALTRILRVKGSKLPWYVGW